MTILDARGLLALPGGDSATDTVIGGIHFNKTVIERFGYQLYSNGTLSNDSSCILIDPPYTPIALWENGTFINVTTCFEPIRGIGPRSKAAIGYLSTFGVLLVLTLVCLNKHGRLYLPKEKRFYPIGRRWQWYFGIITAVAAFISLFTNVDVDRYYLSQLPILVASFFWYLMQMAAMCCVWEAVRHWSTWMERQFIDPDPFSLREDDRRARIEFWLPLFFYLFLWLHFFMVVPRNWGAIELQRSPEQTVEQAVPTATDARFKAAAFLLFVCWAIQVFSLRHSIKHYRPRNRGIFNRVLGFLRFTPLRFLILLPLALAMVAYQALCAWNFDWSPLKVNSPALLPIFLGGYTPALLILAVQVLFGWLLPNEDKELIRQRRARGAAADAELGLVRKPAWWRRVGGLGGGNLEATTRPANRGVRDRIARNIGEIGGGPATARHIDAAASARAQESEALEMGEMQRPGSEAGAGAAKSFTPYGGKSEQRRGERAMQAAAGMLFPNAEPAPDRRAELMMDGPPPGPPPPYGERGRTRESTPGTLRPPSDERSASTGGQSLSPSVQGPPTTVRSMLDI
jgi:hypothetical protein